MTTVRSEFGLRFDHAVVITGGDLIFTGRAAWAHDYNDDRVVTATFQSLRAQPSWRLARGLRPIRY